MLAGHACCYLLCLQVPFLLSKARCSLYVPGKTFKKKIEYFGIYGFFKKGDQIGKATICASLYNCLQPLTLLSWTTAVSPSLR